MFAKIYLCENTTYEILIYWGETAGGESMNLDGKKQLIVLLKLMTIL